MYFFIYFLLYLLEPVRFLFRLIYGYSPDDSRVHQISLAFLDFSVMYSLSDYQPDMLYFSSHDLCFVIVFNMGIKRDYPFINIR